MTITVDIRPTGIESAIGYVRFDKALAELQKNGYKLISLSQNAELRIQQGKDHNVSTDGNWVKEGVLYIPEKGRFITRYSPVLDNPRKAIRAHIKNEQYFVSDDQIGIAMRDSIQIPYDVNEIPTDRFSEDPIPIFCFGKNAKDYGLFLKDAGISNMPLCFNEEDYVQKQGKSYANQLWFSGLDYVSILRGDHRGLPYVNRSRGVK